MGPGQGGPFDFLSPGKILFGEGRARDLASIVSEFGSRAVVVTGATVNRHSDLLSSLGEHLVIPQSGEPTVSDLLAAVQKAQGFDADVVIGLGGGSAIDLAKATGALLANSGDVFDYLEVIGSGLPLESPALPIIAVPTTSGTGSEATKNAVLGIPEHRVKVSMRHPSMLPRVAIVDPELSYGLPPAITATTGLDALTQLIEPLVSRGASPMTDALCRSAIPLALGALRTLHGNPSDRASRRNLSYASLCSGLALANAGLGAVHGIAGPLGGMIPIPHGAACARLLAPIYSLNETLAAELPSGSVPRLRFEELSTMIAGAEGDASKTLKELADDFGIPNLSESGLRCDQIPELVEKASRSSSMKGNPFPLSPECLTSAVEKAF